MCRSLTAAHPAAASLVTLNSAVLSSSFSVTSCADCGEGRMRKYVSMVWCCAGSACCVSLRMVGARRRPADGHDHHLIYHCVHRVTWAAERPLQCCVRAVENDVTCVHNGGQQLRPRWLSLAI